MAKSLLTKEQKRFLDFFSKTVPLNRSFYFSGGTCLSEFYLHHRLSEDLDFFSEKEFNSTDVTAFLKASKKRLGYQEFDYQQSFNRNIFHLIYSSRSSLKIEFTYFPFERIEKVATVGGLTIDSLKDIAVNKIFTISQKPRGRDFFDIYCIFQKTKYSFKNLLLLARAKFDWHIDYLQFGANLLEAVKLKDDPILKNAKTSQDKIGEFFLNEAKNYERSVLK